MKVTSANALLAQLRAAQAGEPERVPDGWLTARGWARQWKISDSHARRLIERGVVDGLLNVRKFRVKQATRVIATPHYCP